MLAAGQTIAQERAQGGLTEDAVKLLSQQIWCWGRDILRPEGNWLIEVGFERLEPPANRSNCSSVYQLELPHGRCVVLRGFGAFYGDRQRGGVFVPRSEFRPQYTTLPTLERPPWLKADLPRLKTPSEFQRAHCASLTLDLIDWIRNYEVTILRRLGIEYRRSSLVEWDNGARPGVPAEQMASAWRELSFRFAANSDAFVRRSVHD